MRHRFVLRLTTLALLAGYGHAQTPPLLAGNFPNVAVPAGNPITPDKVQLGKALFFEEQLSFDDTMACATCHLPESGGGDPRAGARAPGDDGLMNTWDPLESTCRHASLSIL